LILFQDHSTSFGYFLYPSSGVQYLQLTAIGTTYITFGSERCGKVRLKMSKSGSHITMTELELNHDVTIYPIWTFLNGLYHNAHYQM
jgi:hypothetical protein